MWLLTRRILVSHLPRRTVNSLKSLKFMTIGSGTCLVQYQQTIALRDTKDKTAERFFVVSMSLVISTYGIYRLGVSWRFWEEVTGENRSVGDAA